MTRKEIRLVQESWARIVPDATAKVFYGRLFELDPSLRPLFPSDLVAQGRKLMTMLAMVVNGLNDLERILPAIRDSGRRHTGYGVKDEHYETVGNTLLWTLERVLGDAFTEDTRRAWIAIYELLANEMKAAAALHRNPLATSFYKEDSRDFSAMES
jgi:hemoglobin-like flavoprotein